jgi:uncharacterized protein
MRIVIPGGSGQVGRILARHFHATGHDVTVLSRTPRPAPWRVIPWDLRTVEHCDVCINLAGRSVNCRYNSANRRAILDSRVETTKRIGSMDRLPPLWINASTATIYRHALDRPMDEATGEIGDGFSVNVATAWEDAFFSAATPHTRKVAIRSVMTFSPDAGGVFDVLSGLVRVGLGGTQGPGSQYVSWIHHVDFIRAVEFLIARNDIAGVVNLASPNPLTNREFMRALREAWGVRIGLAAPAWLLEIGTLFMRTETELVLKSRWVVPGRLLDEGFTFQFPDWPAAAHDLVTRSTK